jgi:hypothetical protein
VEENIRVKTYLKEVGNQVVDRIDGVVLAQDRNKEERFYDLPSLYIHVSRVFSKARKKSRDE